MTESKRQTLIDPAVREIMTRQDQKTSGTKTERTKKAKERKKAEGRLPGRVNLDLTPDLKKKVFDLAEAEKIPASQLVAFFLADGLRRLEAGELNFKEYRRPSTSPRYSWTLDLANLNESERI